MGEASVWSRAKQEVGPAQRAAAFNVQLAGLIPTGGGEWVLILLIVLLLFGGTKLPALAKGLGQSMKELDAFFKQRRVRAPYVDTRMSGLDPAVYIPGARGWQCDTPDPVAPEWVAVSADRLLHEQPNCEQLLRYPSWTVGDGTIMVFRITDSKLSPDLKPREKSSTAIP